MVKRLSIGTALALLVGLIAVRGSLHAFMYRDGLVFSEIAVLDVCGLVMVFSGLGAGRLFGRVRFSLTACAVVLVLPMALGGCVSEVLGDRHLSDMSAWVSLSGAATGVSLVARNGSVVWGALGSVAAALALTQVHELGESLLICAPYVGTTFAWPVLGRPAHAIKER